MKLVAPTPPVPLPRQTTNAAGLIALFFTDAVTGQPMVSERWVREHVPGKRRVSHNMALWFVDEVRAWLETEAAA